MNLESNIVVKPSVSEGISDGECVQRVQSGETDAFETLIRRHQKTIFNVVYRMLGDYDEAVETAQEVFLAAYRSIGKFRRDANFSTWLYRIAINHASTRRKSNTTWSQRTVRLDTIDPVPDRTMDPAMAVEKKQVQDRVQNGLNRLDPDHAAIIVLVDMQGISYEQAAEMLGVAIGTVKSRLHRAHQALKTELKPFFTGRNQ